MVRLGTSSGVSRDFGLNTHETISFFSLTVMISSLSGLNQGRENRCRSGFNFLARESRGG